MVLTRECSFCKEKIEPGTGKMLVRNDGSIYFFCSSKCEKNLLKLRRKPFRTRWTKVYREK
ncbi:MAG: 50S ribosomal protein L24e [Methanobacteriota archaeon]|nr:MAG: 50S ribosomal protein L24e [Euryarchaeota archaeon]